MNKEQLPDLFGMAKTVDIKDYIETFYGMEFSHTGHTECPFCGSKDNFSVNIKKQFVKCFGCMPRAVGIVDFVAMRENSTPHLAAKKICVDMGLYIEDNTLSAEEKAKRAEELAAQRAVMAKERAIKMAKLEKETKAKQEITASRMREDAPKFYTSLLSNSEQREALHKKIRWSSTLDAWWGDYLGYDDFHQSIVIINQDQSSREIYNIKHYQKWEYDQVAKKYNEGTRSSGKWISQANSRIYPFPIEYFREHDDERVVISFGEKDALNLLGYNINTLTLGGISNSFEPFKKMLKGKSIYIWCDNQLVEYLAAMARYKELEDVAKEIYIVSFFHIDKTLPLKYDISDFILDNNFNSKEEIFAKIEYSCFKLGNSFIEDIENFFSDDDAKLIERLNAFRSMAKSKRFQDIEVEILKASKPIKSEMDKEINACEEWLVKANDPLLKAKFVKFVGTLFDADADEYVDKVKLALDYKQRLYNLFRKHHEVDATIGFVNDARASGHEIASYRSDMFVWTGSHYQKIDDKELKTFIIQKWMVAAKVNMKQQTPDFMKKVVEGIYYRAVALERLKENQNYRIINFDNGTAYLYNSGKLVFRPTHLKADAMTSMLPISYDPAATAPKWTRFLNEVLPDKTEQDALMEFIGYCFLNTHSFQKFLFLLGSGANGKSIVLNVIKKFFGQEITSNVDLQQLFGHEMIGIDGKYINIGSEINPKGLDKGQIENLKKLTAGEATQLNPKNATPYDISGGDIPKFLFSGNNKPQGNLDGGLFRRMLLLNFDKTISKKDRIQALEDRFDGEMSGIFNLAIEGLARLLANGDFSVSENMERNLQEYKEESNPVLAYFNENIEIDKSYMVARKFLYGHYKAWCEERGHHSATERNFYSRLRDMSKDIEDKQTNYNGLHSELCGKNPKFIKNLRVKVVNISEFSIDKVQVETKSINIHQQTKLPVSIEE